MRLDDIIFMALIALFAIALGVNVYLMVAPV